MRRKALEFKQVLKIRVELVPDLPVQFRGNYDAGGLSDTGKTEIIKAGHVAQEFRGQAEVGRLDRMDQRTGTQQMVSSSMLSRQLLVVN